MKRRSAWLVPMATAAMTTGCGEELDRVSEVKTVRVLGVRKQPPRPAPGETVSYQMLWHDGRADPQSPVELTWLGGCTNPPGDQFLGCFDALASSGVSGGVTGAGARFELTMPEDAISSRRPPADESQPPFATSFVFFSACAGRLGPDPEAEGLPLACFDDRGGRLGADDFVLGFTQSLITESEVNRLPSVLGFRVQGRSVAVDCIDDGCLDAEAEEPIRCPGDPRCIAACAADASEDDCPEIRIEPELGEDSAEVDPRASATKGAETYEQVWVDYFSDRGRVGVELGLVASADGGPTGDWSSRFYAPAEKGPVRLWAVVKDSRGGVSWVRLRLQVD